MKVTYREAQEILNNLDIPLSMNDSKFKPTLKAMGFTPASVGPYSVTARVDKDTRQALTDYAVIRGVTAGDIVREALSMYFKGATNE
jgi:hypothetical protein